MTTDNTNTDLKTDLDAGGGANWPRLAPPPRLRSGAWSAVCLRCSPAAR